MKNVILLLAMEKALGKTFGFIAGIIFAIIIFSLISCSKEETVICKTCTVTTEYKDADDHTTQTYIESQTEYCNGEADTIQQGLIYHVKVSSNGGATYNETKKTRECK